MKFKTELRKTKRSFGEKILMAMLTVVITMLLLALAIFGIAMNNIYRMEAASNQDLNTTIGQMSSDSMAQQTETLLLDMAVEKAEIADGIFAEFARQVGTIASAAEAIYSHPGSYGYRPVPLPDPSRDGELTVQVLYSASVDPADPAIKAELGLIGNVQDVLMAVNDNSINMASAYVATESGFMVQADYISAKKYDEAGNLLPLEAKERPWYRGASILNRVYFTPVTKDAHSPRLGIMCGIPIYAGEEMKGVAGAGMYLEDMESLVEGIEVGADGIACIINQDGKVLFSTEEEGTLAAVVDGKDLRRGENRDLSRAVTSAMVGLEDVKVIDIDGVPSYVAYAKMKTVNWAFLVVLPQEEVEAPTRQMLLNLNAMTEDSLQDANRQIRQASYMMLLLFGLAVAAAAVISVVLSRHIVRPIRTLTDKVSRIEGEKLDFTWDLDTGDETQTLAESFASMTQRMNEYIENIRTITAEKERIGTELSLAKRIQAAMLPNEFPPFPDRTEFDIYASMDPAREVGGDFYDFFFVDDDHLALVMADVSGKGIGAALFMTICKITLKNYAMQGLSPAEVLRRTNEMICDNNPADMFVTVWIGILELSNGKLTAANAGHEYPILQEPGEAYEIVKDVHGFVVGGFEDETYQEYELQLKPGSRLFVYTDGLPEAKKAGSATDMFGLERIARTLNEGKDLSVEQTLQHMDSAVAEFVQDAEQFDDLTMLCLEYKGI